MIYYNPRRGFTHPLIRLVRSLTSRRLSGNIQYMKNINSLHTCLNEVRPLPFHTWHGEKWEVRSVRAGKWKFFKHLTDALMFAENVTDLDDLSTEARQYWNMVAMS